MSTLVLTYEDSAVRRYDMIDESGKKVGEAVETKPTPEETNAATIRTAAKGALTTNRAFLEANPTTVAPIAVQVKALTRQANGIIRLLLGQLDGTD